MLKKTRIQHGRSAVVLIAAVIMCGFVLSNGARSSKKISFTTQINEDATPYVLDKVLGAKSGSISEIVFEKGIYHFYPDRGYEDFVNISNHDDVLVSTAFPLFDLDHVVIDGQGSTFIFHGRMVPFLIQNCSDLKIKNLSIDWHETFHSEGKVVAKNELEGTFDLEISPTYPYEIRNDQLYFIKEYYEHTIGQSILYDPTRKAIAFDTESYTGITVFEKVTSRYALDKINYKYKADVNAPPLNYLGRQNSIKVEELKPGLVRVHNHRKKLPPVGMILVCKGEKSKNRIAPAISVKESKDLLLKEVTVHHAGGMGLIVENSENFTLDAFKVIPSKDRMVSATADATHFVGCRGNIVLQNCVFTNQLDDGLNVHGTYQEVVKILDERRLGVRVGHFQQQGFVLGRPGDTIGVVRLEDSFFPFDSIQLKGVRPINGRYQILTFTKDIPSSIRPGDLLENLDAYPEILIENNYIGKNRARGLLLSTPKKTIVRNNEFHTEMEAILMPVESGFWYESGRAANVEIYNNIFQDCVHSGQNRGVIRLMTDDNNGNIAFQNIDINNNRFNHFDNLILEVNNTSNLSFRNNIITCSGTFPQLFADNSVIKIKASKDLDFGANHYEGNASKFFASDNQRITYELH